MGKMPVDHLHYVGKYTNGRSLKLLWYSRYASGGGGQVQGWKVLRDTNSISVYLSQYCWLGSAESRGLIQGARPCKPGSSLSLPSAPVFVVSPPADVVHCIAHCAVAHAIADAVAWTAYCSA